MRTTGFIRFGTDKCRPMGECSRQSNALRVFASERHRNFRIRPSVIYYLLYVVTRRCDEFTRNRCGNAERSHAQNLGDDQVNEGFMTGTNRNQRRTSFGANTSHGRHEFVMVLLYMDYGTLLSASHPYCGVMLCGDFNQMNSQPIASYPLKQIVTLATRRHNTLDKVFTNIADWYHISTILPPIGTSDHNVVLVHALTPQPHHPTHLTSCFVAVRSTDPSGKTLLAHTLSRLNWVSLYKMNDCNDMLNYFYSVTVKLLPPSS